MSFPLYSYPYFLSRNLSLDETFICLFIQGIIHFHKKAGIEQSLISAIFPVLLQFLATQKETNHTDYFTAVRLQSF